MSSIVRWDPLGNLMTLRDAMERLFEESVVGPRGWLAPMGGADLALDMYETESDLVITAAIPGVGAEDVNVTIVGNVLTIKGRPSPRRTATRPTTIARSAATVCSFVLLLCLWPSRWTRLMPRSPMVF